jgi:predicted nucleotidyltransferase
MELPFDASHIIKHSGIHPLKIRNIYLYGSRVYGTNRMDSDYDIALLAGSLLEHNEIRAMEGNSLLNIHVITPDKFKRDLENHDMMNLECYYAPDWCRLLEKEPLKFTLNKKRLVKNALAQSFNSWNGAKHKLNDGDIHRGLKSLFHSLKILMFAYQILDNEKIVDYSVSNYYHKEITESDEFEWTYFQNKYFIFKRDLEAYLKNWIKQ